MKLGLSLAISKPRKPQAGGGAQSTVGQPVGLLLIFTKAS